MSFQKYPNYKCTQKEGSPAKPCVLSCYSFSHFYWVIRMPGMESSPKKQREPFQSRFFMPEISGKPYPRG